MNEKTKGDRRGARAEFACSRDKDIEMYVLERERSTALSAIVVIIKINLLSVYVHTVEDAFLLL